MRLQVTIACGDYDRTRALKDGRVLPDGFDPIYLALRPEDIFYRQIRFNQFQVSEMSVGHLMFMQSRGDNPWVGIPIFPSRFFRHRSIWVNADSGIKLPGDLKGKRMGCMDYYMTATIWIRGFLEDDYGVIPGDMSWYQGCQNTPGRLPFLDIPAPSALNFHRIPSDRSLNDMLVTGEIDALMSGYDPTSFMQGHPAVRRLFNDFAQVEQRYFRRTRNFPIMHCIVIQRDLYMEHPWIALSLYKAFSKAKQIAYSELAESQYLSVTLPWLHDHLEVTRSILGDDYWPYGFQANRHDLETLIAYAHKQGMIERRIAADELFAPDTLADPRL
jgi:4,5-dihydroxyphthalate decarboxylase